MAGYLYQKCKVCGRIISWRSGFETKQGYICKSSNRCGQKLKNELVKSMIKDKEEFQIIEGEIISGYIETQRVHSVSICKLFRKGKM